MDEPQVTIRIQADADFLPDFLRELANEIEAREEQEDFDYEVYHGTAEVEYE